MHLIGALALTSTEKKQSFLADFQHCPIDPFTTLDLQNPWHDAPELRKIQDYPDLEGLKLRKVRSGSPPVSIVVTALIYIQTRQSLSQFRSFNSRTETTLIHEF